MLQAVALMLFSGFCHSAADAQQSASPVTAAPILSESVQSGQTFVGTVVPTKTAIIGSAVDGRVIELRVNEGDRVTAQVFPEKENAEQDDREVPKCCQVPKGKQETTEETEEFDSGSIVAKVLTATIELEIKAAQQECVALHQEYLKLENGTRDEEKKQAEALMLAALEVKNFLSDEYERIEKLSKRGAVTERELQEARYKMVQANQVYQERNQAYELAKNGPRDEDIAIAKARRDMQANVVEKLQDQMKKYTIRSKFKGYVVQEFTEAGAWVNRGDPVAEVAALDEVDVLVNVLESQIQYVELGKTVRVEIQSLNKPVLTGNVELIIPRADYKTRTFPVKVRLQNQIKNGVPVIKAGMLARVSLPTGQQKRSLLVPKDAIVLGGRTPAIFVIDGAKKQGETGTARLVPVKIGIAVDQFVAVEVDRLADANAKLEAGSLVVTRGNERLQGTPAVQVTELDTTRPQSLEQTSGKVSQSQTD